MKVTQKFKHFHQRSKFKSGERNNVKNKNAYSEDEDEMYHPRSLAKRPENAIGQEEENDMA